MVYQSFSKFLKILHWLTAVFEKRPNLFSIFESFRIFRGNHNCMCIVDVCLPSTLSSSQVIVKLFPQTPLMDAAVVGRLVRGRYYHHRCSCCCFCCCHFVWQQRNAFFDGVCHFLYRSLTVNNTRTPECNQSPSLLSFTKKKKQNWLNAINNQFLIFISVPKLNVFVNKNCDNTHTTGRI